MFYIELLVKIFWFVFFIKIFLFWLWLWQIKEYRIDRFKAHFETQKIRKIISSFWWFKYPKFTKKIIVIFLIGVGLSILWLFYFPGLFLIILTPLFTFLLILFFQIPVIIWRNNVLETAKQKRKKLKDLLVIGITGSYGKTSTKEFLAEILSQNFNILKTKENQNTEIGIAQCILNELKPEHQIFICEMGAYNKGEIKLLCDIIQPKIGIVTGVNEQHLSLFGSMENLLSAEGGEELIESLPKDGGVVFLNGKNKICQEIYQKIKIKKYLYGQKAELLLENIEGAKAVAKELGMTDEEISRGVEKIENKLPGIKIEKKKNGLTIINAVYSTNPTAVIAHLNYLKKWSGKKIIIMPCLIELGPASKKIHQEIGEKISEVCDLAIITTKDYFKEIKEGSGRRGVEPPYGNILHLENPQLILKKLKQVLNEKDNSNNVILLEGRLFKKLLKELKLFSTLR
jgi:UDP-N-acetylmuramoyl-tripeptide--D-alanyl-D-alanine ligase